MVRLADDENTICIIRRIGSESMRFRWQIAHALGRFRLVRTALRHPVLTDTNRLEIPCPGATLFLIKTGPDDRTDEAVPVLKQDSRSFASSARSRRDRIGEMYLFSLETLKHFKVDLKSAIV